MINNCTDEVCGSLLKPIATFPLLISESVTYYTVFPYVEGESLSAVKDEMYQGSLNPGKLNNLYRSIGFTIGSLHRSGLVNGDKNLTLLKSHLVHGDLAPSNIVIKPDNEIFLVDVDSLSTSIASPQYLTKDIESITIQALPTVVLLFDNIASDWFDAIPEFITTFIDSYCAALSVIEFNDCNIK